MKRLVLFVAAVTVIWVAFQFHDSHPGDPIDSVIFLEIGTVYTMIAVVMLLADRTWRVRALGLLGTVLADAVLYNSFGISNMRHARSIPEPVIDLARSFFVVAAPLLLIGVVQWFRLRWLRRRVPTPVVPPPDVPFN